jgi:hypothetical protein
MTGSITAAFEKSGKGKVTFSHRQHTKTEAKYVHGHIDLHKKLKLCCNRAEIVRWVSENLRPFKIVSDRGFQSLMKTGRPDYYIPSPSTVSRDVKRVFAKCRERIAKMLKASQQLWCRLVQKKLTWYQDYDGDLNFATDAWTSPNHKAYVAVSVHMEWKGKPLSLILDLVEVAKVNTLPDCSQLLS